MVKKVLYVTISVICIVTLVITYRYYNVQVASIDIEVSNRLKEYPYYYGEPEYNYEQLKQDNPKLQEIYDKFLELKTEQILEEDEDFISDINLIYYSNGCYFIRGIYQKLDGDKIIEQRDLEILFSQGTFEDPKELAYIGYKFLDDNSKER